MKSTSSTHARRAWSVAVFVPYGDDDDETPSSSTGGTAVECRKSKPPNVPQPQYTREEIRRYIAVEEIIIASYHYLRMMMRSTLLLLSLCVALSRGFSVRSTAQSIKARTSKIASASLYRRRVISHQENTDGQNKVVLKASQTYAALQAKYSFSDFVSRHTIVWKTSLVVALATLVTRTVAWQGLRQNMLAGTVIFMVGDWGAQFLTHISTKATSTFVVDNHRFVISSILGALWAGIANPSAYSFVENILPGASSIGRVLLKMSITCSILSTAGNYSTMFFRRFLKELLELETKQQLHCIPQVFRSSIQSCNRDFLEVLQDDVKVWPLYDVLCYSLIPPPVRPITNALMASAWSMYMSIASAKTATTITTIEEDEQVTATTDSSVDQAIPISK